MGARVTVRVVPNMEALPCLQILIFILDQESSGRVTHDSHKLQTKAINHSTRHYMNRRELESDQPIHVPLLGVLSLSSLGRTASVRTCIVAIARRRAPHLATTRKDTAAATVLHALLLVYETTCNRQNRVRIEAVQAATSSADCRYKVRPRAHSVVMTKLAVTRAAELASFVCRSSSDLT